MGKGSNTSTTQNQSTTAPDQQAGQMYRDILQRASGVANTPYQAYTGQLTADVNSQQNLGIGGINANADYASPFMQQAAGMATNAAGPVTGSQIQSYLNPYTQNVVDATTGQMQHDNAQQHAQLTGNQISQGALGGNATGVARGILSGQQGRTMASTTAGLYSAGYQQALDAAQRQQQTGLAGANAVANYGIAGQGAALQGAGAQLSAGTLQQQNEQQRLTALYQQYAQQQAFPYQQAQWLAGIGTGVGSNLGGTSSGNGTTTGPAPNQTAQYLGLGLTAAGMLSDRDAKQNIERVGKMNDGTPIYRFQYKGSDEWHVGPMAQDIEKRNPEAVERGLGGLRYIDLKAATDDAAARRAAGGGVGGASGGPWADVPSWIPTIGIHGGPGAPSAGGGAGAGMGSQQQQPFDPEKLSKGLQGAVTGMRDFFGPAPLAYGSAITGAEGPTSVGGAPLVQSTGVAEYNGGRGLYAAGGGVDFDDRFNSAFPGRMEADIGDPTDPAWAGTPDTPGGISMAGVPDPGSANRGLGHAMLRDRAAVINPDDPVRMPDQGAVDAWRKSTPLPGQPAAPMTAQAEDDDELPTAAAPTSGAPRGVAGAPATPGAPGADPYFARPDAVPSKAAEERAGFGLLPISKNAGTGLMAVGLGMMASRSPFLGTAVGEGGLTGVAAYGAAQNNDQKIATEAAKLSREAQQQNFTNKLGLRKQDESERHNRASEKETVANRAPMGMRFNKAGELEDIPGWTKTLEKAAKARKGPEGEVMDDDTAKFMADRIIAGDTKVLTGLGRGAQGAANIMKVQQLVAKRAASGEPVSQAAREILNNAAQFEGLKTAERTQAGIMAKLSVYGRTAFNATDLALELSEAVPRTNWQPINRVLNAARTKTGDPAIVALGQALQTLSNEYARAIGGGHGTVHMQEQAEKRLSEVQSKEQLKAVVEVMRREILAEERAMPAARQHIRDIYNPNPNGARGKSIAGEHGAQPPAGPVSGASGLQEGRTGTKGGRPVVVKGGKLVYSDTGEAAQ